MLTVLWLFAVIVGFFALAYINAAGWAWTVAIGAALAAAWAMHAIPLLAMLILAVAAILLAIPLNVPVLRRKLISDGILSVFRKVLPPMSQTERDAIEAPGGRLSRARQREVLRTVSAEHVSDLAVAQASLSRVDSAR